VGRRVQRYGWVRDNPDHRDRIYNYEKPLTPTGVTLPKKFSLRSKFPKVFDQLELGSCTANAIVGILMAAGMKQGEAELMLSRLFLYYEERVIEGTVSSDSGAMIRDGIKVVAKEGAPPEHDWPYDIQRFAEKPPQIAYTEAKQH
jgi:C1A family cysteine protease